VRLGFRHFPLSIHPMAKPAAIAAQCASEQGKFWEFYTALFQVSKLDDTAIQSAVRSTRIDRSTWSKCLTGTAVGAVQNDLEEAKRLRLRATPAFVIGSVAAGKQLRVTSLLYGAVQLGDLDAAIAQAEKSAGQQKGGSH